MVIKNFGSWDNDTHKNFEQFKRIVSAQKIKDKDVTVDENAQSCEVVGSAKEPYKATLDTCTCPDFALKKKPCKHIYCLAMRLGYIDGLPVCDKETRKRFDSEAEIKRFYEMFETGAISGEKFIKVCEALQK